MFQSSQEYFSYLIRKLRISSKTKLEIRDSMMYKIGNSMSFREVSNLLQKRLYEMRILRVFKSDAKIYEWEY